MIERVEAHGGRRGSRAYGRYATVEIGNYNRDNSLSAPPTNNLHQLGYHHHSTRNSRDHPCPVTLGFDTSLVPWPELKYSCVRVLELYCKVFDQQELYELIVRKTCKNCKCPRDAHDLFHDEWITVRQNLGLNCETDPVQRLTFPRSYPITPKGFKWAPPNLTSDQVEIFYKDFHPDKVPRTGTIGEQYRDRQLSHQIPKQDLALAYCKHVTTEEHSSYEGFVEARNEVALDVGFVSPVVIPGSACPTCGNTIPVGQLAVFAPKVDDSACWHPSCFTCSYCNEHLVDLIFCKYKGTDLYCERHYADKMKRRCAGCDEISFGFVSANVHLQLLENNDCNILAAAQSGIWTD